MIDDHGRVVHDVVIQASRAEAYAFFTDPEQLVRWIGISADLEPVEGGVFRFEIQPAEHCEGRYVDARPEERVAFSWGWTSPAWNLPPATSLVEVELTDADEGPGPATRVRLVHSQLPGELRALHDEGWTLFLGRLRAVASGDAVPAYPDGAP
jgi:uncharacterized protein YndB with AHSA1/START domain